MVTTTQKIWQRWVAWRDGSDNGRILNAMLIVGASTLIVNLTIFAREIAIAYQFGLSDELDAFLIAFLIPLFTITVLSGSIQAAFIPVYIDIKQREGEKSAEQYASNVLSSSLILMFFIIMVLMLGTEHLLSIIADNFNDAKFALTVRLFYILQPILIIRAVIDIFRGILNSNDYFVVAALTPALIYLTPTILLLLTKSVIFLAIGTLVGHFLQAIVLYLTLIQQGVHISLHWPKIDHHLQAVWIQYLPMIFGSLIMSSSRIIDQTMATWLGNGSVSSLVFGERVSLFVVSIAVTAIGTAVLPQFSKMIAENQIKSLQQTVIFCAVGLLILAIAITGFLWSFSQPITSVVFQRGEFTAADTLIVSQIQSFYFLQIPWYVVGIVFVRLISALKKNKFLTYGAILNVLVNVVGNLLFMETMGIAGIAFSTALVYFVSFIYLAIVAWYLLSEKNHVQY